MFTKRSGLTIVQLHRNSKGEIYKAFSDAVASVSPTEGFKKESAVTTFQALRSYDADTQEETFFYLEVIENSEKRPIR